MSKLSTSDRIVHIVDRLHQIKGDLDTSNCMCDCCERTGFNNKVEGHSAQAIEAAITRLTRAATELRQAATQPPEEE